MKAGKGFSISISFGKWVGVRKQFNREIWRLVIGGCTVALHFYDLDYVEGYLLRKYAKEKGK